MPIYQRSVTTTTTRIIDPDSDRTAIIIANTDASNTIYIGDEQQLSTSNGIPVFPETYILLSVDEGCEVHKAIFAVASTTVDIRIWEHFGSIKGPTRPNAEPPADPVMK